MISVIVPVYKVELYLKQCVDSILNQTYKNLEVILVDDGSPDGCGNICDEYEKRNSCVKVLHVNNGGLSAARNAGIKVATGDYIGFVDSDDWIEPDMYELLLKRLEDARADICVCGFDVVGKRVSHVWHSDEEVYKDAVSLKALLDDRINNHVWNKLYRKEIILDVMKSNNGFLFPEGKNYEDIAVMHNLIAQAKCVASISEMEYHYCMRSDSISKSYSAQNLFDYWEAYYMRYCFFMDKYPEVFDKHPEDEVQLIARSISKIWRWWYICKREEKRMFKSRIGELVNYTRDNIPLFGFRSWPVYLRISSFFMHSDSTVSFATLYALNQAYRYIHPKNSNVL